MSQLFAETKNFKAAIELINNFKQEKFLSFLKRVITKLGGEKVGKIFTEEEEKMFMEMFELNAEEMDILTEGCCFIFEQAAYMTLKPAKFAAQLAKTSIEETKRNDFVNVWEKKGESFIQNLRDQNFGFPPAVKTIKWESHIPLASSATRLDRAPMATLQFSFDEAEHSVQPSGTVISSASDNAPAGATSSSNASETSSVASSSTSSSSTKPAENRSSQQQPEHVKKSNRSIIFEMNHEELSLFSRQLELIQNQLDALSA
ncbi:putative COMM domain-containing protein 10 [Monocercomonoides exilis]|uniref:putative COMM domain-containing protein 10 n=1 Tax=Monocercomonoides exilis TaxID=2049356 RepID=UPI003559DC85|nr:putative COMM domain-containing protein 10 [Monocercomonoides exilis]|eukprot:MONOS_2788.1-p1 / transcript=MONOS_2788.1 / gene=MONOS_2788 / organism=Monocercomonoides_exilis_PA203 / gene_product=COMM domain-containing protein 10 / transcript_product=COMM domain-containing protein 10 / location=Mono_scaffold00060:6217-7342(+) / protein_length=259 / sequence_SO=supercontig / SO=protein_coding / is_pseudo=false